MPAGSVVALSWSRLCIAFSSNIGVEFIRCQFHAIDSPILASSLTRYSGHRQIAIFAGNSSACVNHKLLELNADMATQPCVHSKRCVSALDSGTDVSTLGNVDDSART